MFCGINLVIPGGLAPFRYKCNAELCGIGLAPKRCAHASGLNSSIPILFTDLASRRNEAEKCCEFAMRTDRPLEGRNGSDGTEMCSWEHYSAKENYRAKEGELRETEDANSTANGPWNKSTSNRALLRIPRSGSPSPSLLVRFFWRSDKLRPKS